MLHVEAHFIDALYDFDVRMRSDTCTLLDPLAPLR